MACVTLHMLGKYRSQAKNMHNINKIYMITTAWLSLITQPGLIRNLTLGKCFLSSVLGDAAGKGGFGGAAAEEKEEFCLSGDIAGDGGGKLRNADLCMQQS